MHGRRTFGMLFWVRAGIALCILGLAVLPAFAHDWYDPACCSGHDCAPVSSLTVTAGPGGWHVRLRPGDHFMVESVIDPIIPYDEARESQDGSFHACVVSSYSDVTKQIVRCLYAPPMGM